MLWRARQGIDAHRQYAALPYVRLADGLRVCLITTRRRRARIIPKGWPKPGMAPHELAALEAFEEAGLSGEISPEPFGSWSYVKRLHIFARIECRVQVFPLRVGHQAVDWPEKDFRELIWATPAEAASMIDDKPLARLVRDFGVRPPRGV